MATIPIVLRSQTFSSIKAAHTYFRGEINRRHVNEIIAEGTAAYFGEDCKRLGKPFLPRVGSLATGVVPVSGLFLAR